MIAVFLRSVVLLISSVMPVSIVLTFQVPSLRAGFGDCFLLVAGVLIVTSFSAFGLVPHTHARQTRKARENT